LVIPHGKIIKILNKILSPVLRYIVRIEDNVKILQPF
jgi:hypothetical protein